MANDNQISAEPTKAFFIDMLTRDIALEQAILDLIDNSVDGAKGLKHEGLRPFDGFWVRIEFNSDKFEILDNCGGFDRETAKTYAFRFGRPPGTPRTPHSIGQFGVGMKRALFKFGNHFVVNSATNAESWAVDVIVPNWEREIGWHFPWAEFQTNLTISNDCPGTSIFVTDLRPEVGRRFGTKFFENTIVSLIKSKHRQFVSGGLSISVNGHHIDAISLSLLMLGDRFKPGVDELIFEDEGKETVNVKIVAGVGSSSPRDAGWYVVCNGRVILEADRSQKTGWGQIEEDSDSILIPSFHNQFARFRGIVYFDSNDSARVPWNTTKTDVDHDSVIWQKSYGRMVEMMRPVINFLNELDNDIEEHSKEHSPLLGLVNQANYVKTESLPSKSNFSAPVRGDIAPKGPKTVKVQYSKPIDQVEFLMSELSVGTAKAVGEKTFELTYQRMGGE